jgi:hypothetical protein
VPEVGILVFQLEKVRVAEVIWHDQLAKVRVEEVI